MCPTSSVTCRTVASALLLTYAGIVAAPAAAARHLTQHLRDRREAVGTINQIQIGGPQSRGCCSFDSGAVVVAVVADPARNWKLGDCQALCVGEISCRKRWRPDACHHRLPTNLTFKVHSSRIWTPGRIHMR